MKRKYLVPGKKRTSRSMPRSLSVEKLLERALNRQQEACSVCRRPIVGMRLRPRIMVGKKWPTKQPVGPKDIFLLGEGGGGIFLVCVAHGWQQRG